MPMKTGCFLLSFYLELVSRLPQSRAMRDKSPRGAAVSVGLWATGGVTRPPLCCPQRAAGEGPAGGGGSPWELVQTRALPCGTRSGCVGNPLHLNSAWGFPGGSVVKNLPARAGDSGDAGSISMSGRPLEKEMATHSSLLAWETLWTGEPGGVQSVGPPRGD